MPLSPEQYFSIKKFDGNKSLYFFSNTANNSISKLNKTFFIFNHLERTIEEYEQLLKKYRDIFKTLERELENV